MIRERRTTCFRNRTNGQSTRKTSQLSKKEIQYCAWFLYNLESLHKFYQDDASSPDIPALIELVDAANLRTKFRKILRECIVQAESEGRLVTEFEYGADKGSACAEKRYAVENERKFRKTNIKYKYTVDKNINGTIPNKLCSDSDVIDLCRLLFVSEEDFMPKVVKGLFFSKGKTIDYEIIPARTDDKKIRKLVDDITDVEFMKDLLHFSNDEARLVNTLYRVSTISILDRLMRELQSYNTEIFSSLLNITPSSYLHMIRRSEKLRANGILDDYCMLDDDIIDCIINKSMTGFFSDLITPVDCTKTYSLDTFDIPSDFNEIMVNLLSSENSCNILLRGTPGSGKTEYAKAIAKASGKEVLIFKNENELQGSKVLGRINCYVGMNSDSILILDEADKLLFTRDMGMFSAGPTVTKGIVNRMLENSQVKTIWITNYSTQIDESTKRRFTFSYKFEAMSDRQLRKIANSKISSLGFENSVKEQILDLFKKYKVTGASVDNAMKVLKTISKNENEKLIKTTDIILAENSKLVFGKRKMRQTACGAYDLSILNTSIPADDLMEMIENAKRYNETHKHKAGVRLLFYGLSGTGKTELARYIAESLGKDLNLKRASDILSKYVGEAEANIAQAFEESERDGSILLFDEADSFFADRANASHSWERTQVNEFLTQLEEFPGIVICTTNLRQIMDPAMARRFSLCIEFKPMTAEGINKLLEKYFPELSFTEEQVMRLDELKTVTPGDFGTLSGRVCFMNPEKVTADYIVEEIYKIQRDKNGDFTIGGRIGFAI